MNEPIDIERLATELWSALLGCDDRTLVQGWSREHVAEHLQQAVDALARLGPSPEVSDE